MKTPKKQRDTSTAPGGTVEITTSRPAPGVVSAATDHRKVHLTTSLPSHAGKPIKGAEEKFQPASLKEAEFFRPCPPRGRCPWTRLSRTALIAAAAECGALTRLRQKHKVRGALLIPRSTLADFLRSLAAAGKEVQ